jgi:hypothetical protein
VVFRVECEYFNANTEKYAWERRVQVSMWSPIPEGANGETDHRLSLVGSVYVIR